MCWGVCMTRLPTNIIAAMLATLTFFEERCEDKETLRKLITLANDSSRRMKAHALFFEIRQKTVAAGKRNDQIALAQYNFEEICAKTLYNMTRGPAPFDPDSPFWVLPLALQLGHVLGIADSKLAVGNKRAQERIAAAGNTEVPAYLTLIQTGYTVDRIDKDGEEYWIAEKGTQQLIAGSLLELLGLYALSSKRGPRWQASDNEIDEFLTRFCPSSP